MGKQQLLRTECIGFYNKHTVTWFSDIIEELSIAGYKNITFELEIDWSNCYYEGETPSVNMLFYGESDDKQAKKKQNKTTNRKTKKIRG